jgi:uncharacterized membrane protein YfcA
MPIILAFALAGAAAQLVDGTLGMGFGITSATLLLFFGVAPAAASAATHAAKLPTTLVSGVAHWRQGNVDRAVLLRVALPGMLGGFLGAVVLTGISLASARTWMSALLLSFGVLVFARFGLGMRLIPAPARGNTARWLSPSGLLGGFVDATGGGGWGPVVTPSLFTVTAHRPRTVVGTVSAAEFLVALSVSAGFLTGAVHQDIPWEAVAGLVIGGVIVAPFAARLAGRLPHAPMGTFVGALIIFTNSITIIGAAGGVPAWAGWTLSIALLVGTAIVAARAWRRERAERALVDLEPEAQLV